MSTHNLEVGRVAGLWRYPVKALAAEALDAVDLSWHGFAGDRRWAFVRDGQARNGFPWLTQRERPSLALYTASFVQPERPDRSPIRVHTPSGAAFDVADPDLAAELGGRAMKCDRGLFDAMPLSLLSTQTHDSLRQLVGTELDIRRFRPNLVIEATPPASSSGLAFPEDEWIGSVLRVGATRIRIDAPDHRCAVVGVDPTTAEKNPAVLRAITQAHGAKLGVYASTVQPGRIALGDTVVLEPQTRSTGASAPGASDNTSSKPPTRH